MKKIFFAQYICWSALVSLLFTGVSQGASFRNLDFEEARTNSLSRSTVTIIDYEGPAADLLPGWQLFFGGVLLPKVGYNLTGIAIASKRVRSGVANLLSAAPPNVGEGRGPLQGRFSLSLSGAGSGSEFALVQRGDIPSDAVYLTYQFLGAPFSVTINGVTITRFFDEMQHSEPPNGRMVFANVSRFAGLKDAELRFTTTPGIFGTPADLHTLDRIAFVIPEPSTWALLLLGGAALLWRSVRSGRR